MSIKEIFFDTFVLIYSIIGIGLIVSGLLYFAWISLGWASILISLGIAFIAWGISRKSGILTKQLADVSTKTEAMTNKIAKSTLYETIGIFEDRRLGLRERWGIFDHKLILIQGYRRRSNEFQIDFTEYQYYCSFSIWKCRTYIERAMIFRDSFDMTDENKIIHQVDCFFQDLCSGNLFFIANFHINFQFEEEYQRHLQYIYNKLLSLNRFYSRDDSERERSYRILNNLRYLKGYSTTPKFWS